MGALPVRCPNCGHSIAEPDAIVVRGPCALCGRQSDLFPVDMHEGGVSEDTGYEVTPSSPLLSWWCKPCLNEVRASNGLDPV